MSKHIVSMGDLVLDVILPVRLPVLPGQHQDPGTRRVEPGGAGNVMIAARRMGLNVSAAGTVGADVFGRAILDALQAERIDTTHVAYVPGSTSTLVIVLTDQATGEHTFVGDYGQGSEVPYPAGLDATIASADALFVQGYTLAEARVVPMARSAIGHAIMSEVPIILDVGPFMAHVSAADRAWVVEHTALLLMTEDEMPLVSQGRSGPDAYDSLLAQGPRTLVIKQGAAGCTLVTRDRLERVPGFQMPVVDTVGAGDCFDAAFLAGYLNELSLWECGRLANAMGAAAVGKMGAGRNTPTCDEVMALLRQAGDRIDFPC
jgi:ribokinase